MRTEGGVLQRPPALCELGGGAFAAGANAAQELVVGAVVNVECLVRGSGAFLDRGEDADPGALVAGVGERGKPLSCGFVQGGQDVSAGGDDVMDPARLDVRDPQRGAGGGGEELDVPAELLVLAGVPQIVAVGGDPGDPIGRDQDPVEDQVARSLVMAVAENLVPVGSAVGQDIDTLM